MKLKHCGFADLSIAAGSSFLVGLLAFALPAVAIEISEVRLVSVASDGTPANADSINPSISGDGRYLAFVSDADNLVPDDANAASDVFVHNIESGETHRISIAMDGSESNGNSRSPAISADGNYVAFKSAANNLVPNDTNGVDDVFVHDRSTGETTRVSVASDGSQSIDPTPMEFDVLYRLDISGDGRFVVFPSAAGELVSDDTNGVADAFIHDRDTGETRRTSITAGGDQVSDNVWGPSINSDGRFAVFETAAPELVPGDSNGRDDVFFVDLTSGDIDRISDAPDGSSQNGQRRGGDLAAATISDNGDQIVFDSEASNLVDGDNNADDIFLYDRAENQMSRISQNADGVGADGQTADPHVSGNGRFVLYKSEATNVVPPTHAGDEVIVQAFLHDRDTGQTIRVSGDTGSGQGNVFDVDISADGFSVVISSATRNLISTAPQNQWNLFLIGISESTGGDNPGGGGDAGGGGPTGGGGGVDNNGSGGGGAVSPALGLGLIFFLVVSYALRRVPKGLSAPQ